MTTKIEKFNYLDMDDPKNSWYFDAERFDVNFPLVCSYRGDQSPNLQLSWLYSYFNVVSEHYKSQKNLCMLVIESKYPHEYRNSGINGEGSLVTSSTPSALNDSMRVKFPEYGEAGPLNLSDLMDLDSLKHNINFLPGRKFMFSMIERIESKYYLRFLVCAEHDSLEEFRSKFFYSELGQMYPFTDGLGFPYLQTITTQDWDLVKRYIFFMIRNHQYKYADLIYYLTRTQFRTGGGYPDFMGDVLETLLDNLPEDLRRSNKSRFLDPIGRCEHMDDNGNRINSEGDAVDYKRKTVLDSSF